MINAREPARSNLLLALLIHNGQFASEYPGMPSGFPPAVMGLYAAYGLLAFTHYTLAPMAAHTFVMNATILSEALTALLLLGTVFVFLIKDSDA